MGVDDNNTQGTVHPHEEVEEWREEPKQPSDRDPRSGQKPHTAPPGEFGPNGAREVDGVTCPSSDPEPPRRKGM